MVFKYIATICIFVLSNPNTIAFKENLPIIRPIQSGVWFYSGTMCVPDAHAPAPDDAAQAIRCPQLLLGLIAFSTIMRTRSRQKKI